jgi:hypothetical protein
MAASTTAKDTPVVPYRKAISGSENPASSVVCAKTTSTATNSRPVTTSWPRLSRISDAGYCQAAFVHMRHSTR